MMVFHVDQDTGGGWWYVYTGISVNISQESS